MRQQLLFWSYCFWYLQQTQFMTLMGTPAVSGVLGAFALLGPGHT
jgi:hypothetical protein